MIEKLKTKLTKKEYNYLENLKNLHELYKEITDLLCFVYLSDCFTDEQHKKFEELDIKIKKLERNV